MDKFLCPDCLEDCKCAEDDCTCLDPGGCATCDCGDGATDSFELDPDIAEALTYLATRPHTHEYIENANGVAYCRYCPNRRRIDGGAE